MTDERDSRARAERPADAARPPGASSGPIAAQSPGESPGIVAALAAARGRWLLGAGILIAVIWWVEHVVGWRAVLAPWAALEAGTLALAVTLLVGSYLARAVRLLVYFPGLPLLPTLRLSTQHTAANNLLPMRLGEAVFPILMKRYYGYRLRRGAVSLLWLRLFDLHTVLLAGCVAAWLSAGHTVWLMTAAVLLLGLLAAVVLRERIGRLVAAGEGSRAHALAVALIEDLPGDARRLWALYALTLLTWLLKFVAFCIVLRHFVDVALWQALLGVAAGELSSVLPVHGVAGSGSYEVAIVAGLALIGVPAAAALAGAVNLHLLLLAVTVVLGGLSFLLPRALAGKEPR